MERATGIAILRLAGVVAALAAVIVWRVHRDPPAPRMAHLTGFVALLVVLAAWIAVWVQVKRNKPTWPWRIGFVALAAGFGSALAYLVQRDDVDVVYALGFGGIAAAAIFLTPRRT